MKGLILFSLIFFCTFRSFSQWRLTDLQEYDLGKGVKSLHETWYKAKMVDGKPVKGKVICDDYLYESMVQFNQKGFKTEDKRYKADRSVNKTLSWHYDGYMNVIEEDVYDAGKSDTVKNHFSYVMNDSGQVAEKHWVDNQSRTTRMAVYKYDAKQNLIEVRTHEAASGPGERSEYSYNERGKITQSIDYNSKNKPVWKIVYKRDTSGKIVEEDWYKGGQKFLIGYTYTYNIQGYKRELNWCKQNGKVYMKWTFEYELDDHANFIREVQYADGKVKSIREREIAYY